MHMFYMLAGEGKALGAELTQSHNHTAAATSSHRHAQDKESMAEFIAKKREMFLVQMSLDTKVRSIRYICAS